MQISKYGEYRINVGNESVKTYKINPGKARKTTRSNQQ
jgi:hypothetical protein